MARKWGVVLSKYGHAHDLAPNCGRSLTNFRDLFISLFEAQANWDKNMEGSNLSRQTTEWTVEDVSQIIGKQYNDEVAKKFEGQ